MTSSVCVVQAPLRYVIHERDGERFLVRGDAGNVRLVAARGLHVAAHELRRFPERSIFLDGVFVGPPFLDNERRQYALDHHHGVVRTFTLATCEQAAVLVALGLRLHEGTWHLYLNEPDLDAVLAAWVLLQHDRLTRAGNAGLYPLIPLLRVEGHIDTHGLELPELTGLGPRRIAVERRRLERLRRAEVELRRRGEWATVDPLRHAAAVLEALDREFLVGPARAVRATASTRGERASKVAVLIRANVGVYEVEQALRIRYGDALGRIVLERPGGGFTLLQCDRFLAHHLGDLYPLLDAADPGDEAGDGHGWGGAEEIGGSPRRRPSRLRGEEVLRLLARIDGLEEVVVPSRRRGAPRPSQVTPRDRPRPLRDHPVMRARGHATRARTAR